MFTDVISFRTPGNAHTYGKTWMGAPLEEYRWGDRETSAVFVSGFTSSDRPLCELLSRWHRDLTQAMEYGGILGDFNLKNLKPRCCVRVCPCINADALEISEKGISPDHPFAGKLRGSRLNSADLTKIGTNLRGVDLNRNFNADWISYRQDHPERNDLGNFPESEAETGAFCSRMRSEPPAAALIFRIGENAVFHSEEATAEELREASFLGQYADLPVHPAPDPRGSALQWFTQSGIKAFEIHLSPIDSEQSYPRLRDLLTMTAALI